MLTGIHSERLKAPSAVERVVAAKTNIWQTLRA